MVGGDVVINSGKDTSLEHTNKKIDLVHTIETIVESFEKHSDGEIYKILESVMYIMDFSKIKSDRQVGRALETINSKYER